MTNFSNVFANSFIDEEKFGVPACAETDPEAFFPQENFVTNAEGKLVLQSSYYYNEDAAKALCRECPYRIACLVYAMENTEIGIWGGTTEMERRNMRRAMKRRGHDSEKINLYIKR